MSLHELVHVLLVSLYLGGAGLFLFVTGQLLTPAGFLRLLGHWSRVLGSTGGKALRAFGLMD